MVQERTALPCQGHTTRSVAEVGLEFGIFGLQIGGFFPSLTRFPSPFNSKPSGGRLEAFSLVSCSGWASFHSSAGGAQARVLHPLPPAPHLCSLSDRRGRNSRAGGVSDQAGKRTKELHGAGQGGVGGGGDGQEGGKIGGDASPWNMKSRKGKR